MAGSITVSSITLDSDNTFRILSNTGSSLYTLNSVNQTVTGNLSVDATGTTGIRSPSANTLVFYEGGVEAMRIDSSGNVLIGTTSAATSSTLNVVGTGYQPIYVNTTAAGGGGASFQRSGTPAMYVGTGGSSWLTGSSTADGLMRSEANMLFSVGNTERMRIDASGYVTKPYQPAFYAYMNSGGTALTASNANFVFDTVSVNTGNHYSTSTGRFTAPVAGWYHFSTTILTQSRSNGDQMEIGIYNSANTLGALAARTVYQSNYTGYGGYISGSCSCTFYLNAGDYMRVTNNCGASVYINSGPWAFFSGHLIG